MADLDTTSKRRSSVQILAPYNLAPPAPDGTLDQGDRQHIAWAYSGVLAQAPPTGGGGLILDSAILRGTISHGVIVR